ncbi:MAG: TIR domain-containing protein, partial [Cyanobacteria bacterium J06626_18]
MNPFQDAFISYGRADSRDFAVQLNQRLTEMGLEVWFDFDDIPLGVDYQKQIDDGIDKTDNFLFVISPHAVNSPYCTLELELALKRGKRIIPLMHVEEISYETWAERYPDGSLEDWHRYKDEGKSTSFANMHPAIQKINWVFFREGIDDYGRSLKDLLEIFQRDADYVRRHTILLNRALTWENNHRRGRDLLVEAHLEQAASWLTTQFSDRQPPCVPTRLHCQFISESLKNANDGMTQVFLCHAESDRDAFEQIYDSLIRAGLTVWTSWQDIQKGVDFKEAIDLGIEAADNLVYLLSPDSLRSSWCRHEVQYALSLHKRIVPVLVQPIESETIPDSLEGLQFIDLTDNVEASDYRQDESDLLKALGRDAEYYQAHKLLLTKALKWERQLRNPCVLLRGHPLHQAAPWLEVAQKHARHRPLPIQAEFVQESLKQPPNARLSVFIASNSKDLEFARKLNETLQIQGERTWFKLDETDLGPDTDAQVSEGIERAENCVFVISPEALTDATLLEELNIAATLSKRIIAVSYREFDRSQLPPVLTASPWVDFSTHGEDFLHNFGLLYRVLKSHPQHVRTHTRLLIRALEWQQSDHDDSTLLQGRELTKAETWLEQAQGQTPKPSELQIAYLKASRDLSARKVKPRSVLGVSVGVTLLVLIARLFGLLQGLELAAYDYLLRQRPAEEMDDRFLIVTVEDGSNAFIRQQLIDGDYQPGIGTLPDEALEDALNILNENGPRLIGLDFYRDFPAQPVVAETLENTGNLLAVCKSEYDGRGNEKPPEMAWERVGYTDFKPDEQTGPTFIRRHYLMQDADPQFCNTSTSFSLLLALQYLEQEGVAFTNPAKPEGGFRGNGLQFGNLTIPNLSLLKGPYYPGMPLEDAFGGYQTLLNFRTVRSPESQSKDAERFAPVVTLEDVLTGNVARDQIEGRIVLIGYTDYADRNADYWETPLGEMPGVFLHGQMASQLISAVLDGRSLIRWWPAGGEALWIFAWALAGGAAAWQVVRLSRSVVAIVIGAGLLCIVC